MMSYKQNVNQRVNLLRETMTKDNYSVKRKSTSRLLTMTNNDTINESVYDRLFMKSKENRRES